MCMMGLTAALRWRDSRQTEHTHISLEHALREILAVSVIQFLSPQRKIVSNHFVCVCVRMLLNMNT